MGPVITLISNWYISSVFALVDTLHMDYKRMPIEVESPEQLGYDKVKFNLTESSVSDTLLTDLKLGLHDLKLAYTDHRGKAGLRELIAGESKGIAPEQVLITAGAASALFIVATSLLEKEDHLIVIRPNYASNIETPRAIGCEISYYDLEFDQDFRLDAQKLSSLIRPTTKLISVTHPHNPTGTLIPQKELLILAGMAEKNNCHLLVDETYRELNFENMYPLAASLHDRIISVSSVSKAFGLPGLRIGWLITKNKFLCEKFLAAKEQIFVCNSVVDEEIAFQYLSKKDLHFKSVKEHVQKSRKILLEWFRKETRMEVVMPSAGVICFPRIKNGAEKNISNFYETLNSTYHTFVGPGHWFEMPDHYMRIGYGWPANEELSKGLENISRCLDITG
jgi:aspartate/methionine/tyrosine aminotransferase